MQTYGNHRPTCFDGHLSITPDEDGDTSNRDLWLLVPVFQTRDSGPLDKSNFANALELLGGESDTVEVHRFGHWGPEWYEIIIVKPGSPQEAIGEDIERSLADYPVLNDEDFSNREYEDFTESWRNWANRDFYKGLWQAFRDTVQEVNAEYAEKLLESAPCELLQRFYMDKASNPYECEESGVSINVESTIKRDICADEFKTLLNELHTACVTDYANGFQW